MINGQLKSMLPGKEYILLEKRLTKEEKEIEEKK